MPSRTRRARWAGVLALTLVVTAAGCGHASVASVGLAPSAPAAPSRSSVAPKQDRTPLIDHVQWSTTDKGRQLQVFPTSAGRAEDDPSASGRAWAEIVRDAPGANTPGMYDQFLCHWDFARLAEPDKPSWNLEPWRPAVGYQATVEALCNPGGSEG